MFITWKGVALSLNIFESFTPRDSCFLTVIFFMEMLWESWQPFFVILMAHLSSNLCSWSHLHCPHSPSSDMSRHECLLHAGGAPGSGAAMLQEVSWSPWRWGVRAHTQVPEREPGVRGWEPAVGLITRLGEDWRKAPLPEVTFEPKDGLGLESMQRHDYHAGLDDGSQAGL